MDTLTFVLTRQSGAATAYLDNLRVYKTPPISNYMPIVSASAVQGKIRGSAIVGRAISFDQPKDYDGTELAVLSKGWYNVATGKLLTEEYSYIPSADLVGKKIEARVVVRKSVTAGTGDNGGDFVDSEYRPFIGYVRSPIDYLGGTISYTYNAGATTTEQKDISILENWKSGNITGVRFTTALFVNLPDSRNMGLMGSARVIIAHYSRDGVFKGMNSADYSRKLGAVNAIYGGENVTAEYIVDFEEMESGDNFRAFVFLSSDDNFIYDIVKPASQVPGAAASLKHIPSVPIVTLPGD